MSPQRQPHPRRSPHDVDRFDPVCKTDRRFRRALKYLDDYPRSFPSDVIADKLVRTLYTFIRRYRTFDAATRPQLWVMFPGVVRGVHSL